MEKQSKEVWKDIPGYAGRYQASDQGRIRSFCKDANGRILRGTLNMGYRLAVKYDISRSLILKIAQAKGRWSYLGSKVHQQAACTPKCDLETALAIRKQYSEVKVTQVELAKQYSLNATTIGNIVNGRGAYSELTQ